MAFGQDGIKVPTRGEPGLDPSLASGWLSPDRDRLGSRYYWRDAAGFSEGQRMQWSYNLGRNYSLGMSVPTARDFASPQSTERKRVSTASSGAIRSRRTGRSSA